MRMLKDLAILLGVTVAILFISAYIQHAGKSIDEKVQAQQCNQNNSNRALASSSNKD